MQSEKRKLEQEVIGLNERSRQQDEDNERLKSEISFLRWVVMVLIFVLTVWTCRGLPGLECCRAVQDRLELFRGTFLRDIMEVLEIR